MQIKNTYQTIFQDGDTSDIISVVMMAYEIENDNQIADLARELQGETVTDTCHNIWAYLIKNIRYRADVGKQEIKTPARLIYDGVGDCKSYSLFTAVVLRYLGIDHVFRFVSYDRRKEATHVYVVAFDNSQLSTVNCQLIIDAVAYVQAQQPFNKELKYTYRCDMSKGTKIAYLAGIGKTRRKKQIGRLAMDSTQVQPYDIYSDNGFTDPGNDPTGDPIGYPTGDLNPQDPGGDPTGNPIGEDAEGVDNDRYAVWTGNESEFDITPGKHFLYSRFDLLLEMVNIATTNDLKLWYYNQLDITTALLWAYNRVNGNMDEYKRISLIVCGMVKMGWFNSASMVEDVRGDALDELLNRLDYEYTNNSNELLNVYDQKTWDMLVENVFQDMEPVSITGSRIGSLDVIGDTIKKSGYYFLYLFIPDGEVKNYPAAVAKKRLAQKQVFDWLALDIFHKRATKLNLIRAGIIARTGMEPEAYIAKCKRDNIRIGEPITLATIATIISIVIGLIAIVRAIWPPKTTPTNEDIKNGGADVNAELFTTKKGATASTASQSSFVSIGLPVAIGLAALIGFFRKH
ncbi:MAG: transglutaminase domain-containing protein [Paludibacter sp.]